MARRFSSSACDAGVRDQLGVRDEDRVEHPQAGGAQGAARLGDLDDRVGDLGNLRLGGAVRERDPRVDPVLLEEAPRELRVLRVHAHVGRQIADRLPRRVAGDREHHPDRAGGGLRVVQLGERHDLDARLLDPVAAGDADVEEPVGDVARDLLRAQDRDVDDARVVDRGLVVDVGRAGEREIGILEQLEGRLSSEPFGSTRRSTAFRIGGRRPAAGSRYRSRSGPRRLTVAFVPGPGSRDRGAAARFRGAAPRGRAGRTTTCPPARAGRGTPRAGSSSTPPKPSRQSAGTGTGSTLAARRASSRRCASSPGRGALGTEVRRSRESTRRRSRAAEAHDGSKKNTTCRRGDALHLAQAAFEVGPVVHRERGERGVERAGRRTAAPRRAPARPARRAPDAGAASSRDGSTADDDTVGGLVAACARTDVHDARGVAERGRDLRGDTRVGAARRSVRAPDRVVARHAAVTAALRGAERRHLDRGRARPPRPCALPCRRAGRGPARGRRR